MVAHSSLTGADLHEPKGVETASEGQVYVSDGKGSGLWKDPLSRIPSFTQYALNGKFDDVSVASSVFFIVPQKGTLTKISGVLSGALTGSDTTLTVYKNNVAQTPTLKIPFTGSGAGVKTVGSFTISVAEDDLIEIRSAGESTGPASFSTTVKFTVTT